MGCGLDLDLMFALVETFECAGKLLLRFAVQIHMPMSRLGTFGEFIGELEGLSHLCPVFRRGACDV